MRSQRQHVEAIRLRLEAALGRESPTTVRRLLRPQLRWVAQRLGEDDVEELARELGVLDRVEAARNEHLASLDADEGLVALQVGWADVVAATERRRPSARRGR